MLTPRVALRSILRQELFILGVAPHLKISFSEPVSCLNVAWIEFDCLSKISHRRVPAILVPINLGRDQKRFRVVRQFTANNRQLVTCPVEITSVSVDRSVEVVASEFQMSLAQIRADPQCGLRRFLCQLEVRPRQTWVPGQ